MLNESLNVELLHNMRSDLNLHSAIGKDLCDWEWSNSTRLQFVRVVFLDVYLLSNSIVEIILLGICTTSSFIDKALAFVTKRSKIHRDRNIQSIQESN